MAVPPGATGNLLTDLPRNCDDEVFEELLRVPGGTRLERIVSTGQATPAGTWYDQSWGEWVLLVSGQARLRFESEPDERVMNPGDYVWIPANCRHRVEWTDPERKTVWLAVHASRDEAS